MMLRWRLIFPRMRLAFLAIILLACLSSPAPVFAHDGEPHSPQETWASWNWDPLMLLGIGLTAWLYFWGVRSLWARAGMGRGVSMYRVGAFYGGLAALFVALVSPIDALAGALFSFHMVQHLLLMLVAAPLLVLGAPPVALAWAAPRSALPGLGRWWRRQHALGRLWKGLAHPLAAWVLHALAVWVWHMPGPYQAALRSETIHFLEHFSFLATALLFWWVLARCGEPGKLSYAGGIFYVFTTALHSGVLGALMTFSRTVWYPIYTSTAAEWGLTALEDQQLAGSIMWVPANFFYLIATLVLLWKWFEGLERKDTARQPDLGQTGG